MAVVDSDVKIKAQHMEKVRWYANEFSRVQPLAQAQQERFERSKIYVEEIYAAMGRAAMSSLASDEQSAMRQAEMLSYHLSECRRADEELALLRNQVAVLREALSLFLAESYGLDVSKEWFLDAEKGVLSYDEPVHTGLRYAELPDAGEAERQQ